VEGVAHCTAESSLQLSPQTLKILEKAVESKGDVAEDNSETLNILEKAVEAKDDLAEDMECKNIMMVQHLPLRENFAKIVLRKNGLI
jgi:phosphohistidine phosphatase SixA